MDTHEQRNINVIFNAPDSPEAAAAYKMHYRQLYNYGRKLTDNNSLIEDAIHDVFVSMWQVHSRNPAMDASKSYVYSSFRRKLFRYHEDAIRRMEREERASRSAAPEFGADHILILREQDQQLKAAILQALQQLTPRQREAVYLRFYENMQYDEIATVMDISVKATYKLMARALDELKQLVNIPFYLLLPMLRLLFIGQ
ncbi:RNA polymerase sigma factor, sigma-70 family [Chitinophaga eiseniae]|uniref:RNA polymerase sigma factor, sigma-70 family n=1 Tax=Chitinophaga eiseniae TaxID=634771 RepID=A0A1T4TTZ8_9BACT|nr:sigma-70 family RNA polymerase sigma factor [Chitinophaga eiseniae]SKA43955.1 RNA polymerase sigma factor, sigma-70 family [Chitinophaga eiseniae]